jgi:hypothetical protein
MPATPTFAAESARVRVQRFGAPRAVGRALLQMWASVAVVTGLAGLAALGSPRGSVFVGLAVIAGLGATFALLASVPLSLGILWKGLFAQLARHRSGGLLVRRSLRVVGCGDDAAFVPADVVSVEVGPGEGVAIRMEDGDLIHAEVGGARRVARLVQAIAAACPNGPWIAPLHPTEPRRTWPQWAAAALVACAIVAMAVGRMDMFACGGGCLGLALWLTLLRPRPPRLRLAVGADGVAIRTDTASRFVSFGRIERVEPAPFGAVLVLGGGERLPLAVVPPPAPDAVLVANELEAARRACLLRRLEAGIEATSALAGAERLARQGRSVDAWRDAVRDLVKDDAADYRAALLPTEQAARIVEDGRASPEARIGAALALSGRADEPLRRRLRVAIGDCVDDATRHALSDALVDRLEQWTLDRVEHESGSLGAPLTGIRR